MTGEALMLMVSSGPTDGETVLLVVALGLALLIVLGFVRPS